MTELAATASPAASAATSPATNRRMPLSVQLAERLPLPDAWRIAGIEQLVERTKRGFAVGGGADEAAFAAEMTARPIAEFTAAANEQHYELPPEFFRLVLGPRAKYSSCLYADLDQRRAGDTLAAAEDRALAETAAHAALADGQDVLELGCGWGSLSLWMAATYPGSRITAVSNSAPQRRHIEALANSRGLGNLTVVTADMNDFDTDARFDRIVSVEMFEHMANWAALLERVRRWIRPDGRLFIHVFSHRTSPYRFDHADRGDWIAQYFFTGGVMPSHGLIRQFDRHFAVEADWRWDGRHYQRTALDWLANMDRNNTAVSAILRDAYGADASLWRRRWRLFFLATAGLFGHAQGTEWGVSHYRLRPL